MYFVNGRTDTMRKNIDHLYGWWVKNLFQGREKWCMSYNAFVIYRVFLDRANILLAYNFVNPRLNLAPKVYEEPLCLAILCRYDNIQKIHLAYSPDGSFLK